MAPVSAKGPLKPKRKGLQWMSSIKTHPPMITERMIRTSFTRGYSLGKDLTIMMMGANRSGRDGQY